jgi:hypothetical protein
MITARGSKIIVKAKMKPIALATIKGVPFWLLPI